MQNLFDNSPYDHNSDTILTIGNAKSIIFFSGSGDAIYTYMNNLMLPLIFDESFKVVSSNPYVTN